MQKQKKQSSKILILGAGDEALQLLRINNPKIKIIGIIAADNVVGNELAPLIIKDQCAIDLQQINTIILTSTYRQEQTKLIHEVCNFLAKGINVISTFDFVIKDLQAISDACTQGNSKFQVTNIFPHVIFEQFALTLSKVLTKTTFIHVQQIVQLKNSEIDLLKHLGFGLSREEADALLEIKKKQITAALDQILRAHFEFLDFATLKIESEILPIYADHNNQANILVAIQLRQSVYQADKYIIKIEEMWTTDAQYIDHQTAIYGQYHDPLSFDIHVEGEPSLIRSQLEFSNLNSNDSVVAFLNAQAVLNILHVFEQQSCSGIYTHDSSPRYQLDHRLPIGTNQFPSQQQDKKKKVIIWGPGEIGGAVVRAILQRPNIQIVGAKVFSAHKHGKDLGTLVGIQPLGIYATSSTSDLLALEADYVIVTPQPRAIVEGLDQQVIEILKAGKNVITSAAYHNVTMPNWLMSAQTPSQLLSEALKTHGIAKNKQEEIAFELLKKLQKPISKLPILKHLKPTIDQVLHPVFNKFMPFRATPKDLLNACQQGQAYLHGTGVHPSFMAERIGIMLANFLPNPQHMRFIEAVDFSYMPDGMWGGLNTIGFGLPVDELDENFIVAKAGDFYYGDVTGNVGHLLFGASNEEIRIERRFSAIPAKEDFKVGSTLIKKGHAAALHMMHLGYIGDHHFFTNEECWYLGPNEEFRGENLPFGNFNTPISYTVQVKDYSAHQLNMQLSMDGTGKFAEILNGSDISTADQRCALGQIFREQGTTNPITNATAMAILDAIEGIDSQTVGIVIDDINPRLKRVRVV